jgi:cobyrinic acid a,c-diamide synthase
LTIDRPRIVIAGNRSGVGKTTFTLALTAALKRKGLAVQTYKTGPDFLDPTWLSLASGRPCYNLDGWMSGEEYVRNLFARTSADADIAVIEGAMGLFDGAPRSCPDGSTAEIARWLDAPVLLVADAHGMSRSLAALVQGYAGFEAGVKIAGVIANNCGSARHGSALESALQSAGCPPLLGAVTRGSVPALESRHLGLVAAGPSNASRGLFESLADACERFLDPEKVVQAARRAAPLPVTVPARREDLPLRVRLGVALDSAFHFYYQDLFDELAARGCVLEFFSPVRDEHLPEQLHGLYIGGGYPEAYAPELAANESMLSEVRVFAGSGRPVYAECGGLMYLSRAIETLDGTTCPMAGILPASSRMLERRQALGYVESLLERDTLWGTRGDVLRGHEFHYSELTADPAGRNGWDTAYSLKKPYTGASRREGYQRGRILASYVHQHLAGRPEALDRFVGLCKGPPGPGGKP